MLKWLCAEFLQTGLGNPARIELFTGDALGFSPLLLVGAIEELGMPDLRLGRGDNGLERITMIIRNIKTDQFNEGVFKTSQAAPGPICHVKAVSRLMTSRNWVGNSEEEILITHPDNV